MKTIKAYPVQMLRILPNGGKLFISKVNKVESMRVASLVFATDLPWSGNEPEVKNVLTLTMKQIESLASLHGIRATGSDALMQLSALVGVGRSAAFVTSTTHTKGEKYVIAGTDKEKEHTENYTQNNVDSIVLAKETASKLEDAVIEKIVNWKDTASDIEDILGKVVENPVLTN